jgi:catechol 2,3-dioxygenase
VLDVTDLGASRAFYQEIGLHLEDVDDGAVYFRGCEESQHHSLVLRRAGAPGCARIAFKVASEGDLDRAAAFCADNKLPHAFAAQAFQGRTLVLTDPFGVRIGLYATMDERPMPPRRDNRAGSHPQSFASFHIVAPEMQDSVSFYTQLGFRIADRVEENHAAGPLTAAWMRRSANACDIAFVNGPGPRLHHVAYRVPNTTDILRLSDALAASGHLETLAPARHRRNASDTHAVYIRDPDGHRLKLFADKGDNTAADQTPSHRSPGALLHAPSENTATPRPCVEDATPFAGQAVRAPQSAADLPRAD